MTANLASYRDDEEMDALITSTLDQMISTLSDYQRQDQRVKRRQKHARGGAKVTLFIMKQNYYALITIFILR